MHYRKNIFQEKSCIFLLSNCFRQFYIQQNNNKKLKKHAKTSNNTKILAESNLKMTKAKQKY